MTLKRKSCALLAALSVLTLALPACKDEEDLPNLPNQETTAPTPPPADPCATIDVPVAMLSGLPGDELGVAVSHACIRRADLSAAQVAVVTGSDLGAVASGTLRDFYDRGGLVMVVHPDANTASILQRDLGESYQPLSDGMDALAYVFNRYDRHFILLKDGAEVVDANPDSDITDDELASLEGMTDEGETGEEVPVIDSADLSEDHHHGHEYYAGRLEMLIGWINAKTSEPMALTGRGADGYDPRVDISRSYSEVTLSIPVELHNKIDKATWSKADYLNYDTDIAYTYYVYPLYIFATPGVGDAAGDYYAITGAVTARNGDIWHPQTHKHGGCNIRIVGYFMRSLDISFALVDAASEQPVNGVQFYGQPIPETTQGSTTYSNGVTMGFDLSASGKKGSTGSELGGSAGFHASWSSTVSQTLNDVLTERHTRGNALLSYHYGVQNINSSRNFNDKHFTREYPLLSRSDFSAPQAWIWKVPHGKAGVGNDTSTGFKMKVSVSAKYGVYSWWRGASWSKDKTYDLKETSHCFSLEPPSRKSFGVIALQNAGTLTVANVTITGADGHTETVSGSFNRDQVARHKMHTGVYTVSYDLVDPDKDNKKVSRWKFTNVTVSLGADEQSSTTLVSTVNATKVKDY